MVGLGWLLTSLTELRRVDEKEEVARPLGAEVGEVGQGTEVLECGPERAPLEAEEALRRSGRSRVAAGVKAEPEAEGDDEAEVQSTGKLKGERMPPVELERDAVDYDVRRKPSRCWSPPQPTHHTSALPPPTRASTTSSSTTTRPARPRST